MSASIWTITSRRADVGIVCPLLMRRRACPSQAHFCSLLPVMCCRWPSIIKSKKPCKFLDMEQIMCFLSRNVQGFLHLILTLAPLLCFLLTHKSQKGGLLQRKRIEFGLSVSQGAIRVHTGAICVPMCRCTCASTEPPVQFETR